MSQLHFLGDSQDKEATLLRPTIEGFKEYVSQVCFIHAYKIHTLRLAKSYIKDYSGHCFDTRMIVRDITNMKTDMADIEVQIIQ